MNDREKWSGRKKWGKEKPSSYKRSGDREDFHGAVQDQYAALLLGASSDHPRRVGKKALLEFLFTANRVFFLGEKRREREKSAKIRYEQSGSERLSESQKNNLVLVQY